VVPTCVVVAVVLACPLLRSGMELLGQQLSAGQVAGGAIVVLAAAVLLVVPHRRLPWRA
jgi:small neutral amino acid transporter SnatA (MarC family)